MVKAKWKQKIIEQCRSVGTYQDAFLPMIESLAGILEQRDRTHAEFTKSGGKSVVLYTNKAGAENMTKNPLLVLWDDLNKSALAYWRDLGLTPAGLKKINEEALNQQRKKNPLAEVLALVIGCRIFTGQSMIPV